MCINSLVNGYCTNCSLYLAFSSVPDFSMTVSIFYSVLSLYDISSERTSVTIKSKVATGLVACTLFYFTSSSKVDLLNSGGARVS